MPVDPVTGAAAAGFIAQSIPAVVEGVTKGGPRRQFKWNKRAADHANYLNRGNQQWLLEQNKRLQAEQRMYDSPESQMARYKAAGLNPHLIYGSGSSAGGVFPIDAGNVPGVNVQAPSSAYPDIAGAYLRAGQVQAQTGLSQQKTVESEHKTALMDIQKDIAKTNPMLNQNVYMSTIYALEQAALLKSQQSRFLGSYEHHGDAMTRGENKVQMSVDKMIQDLQLGTQDLKIRNEILEGKGYQNALLKIQQDWMKDADVTPQHIYQGMMLVLSKMLGR